MCTYPVFCWYGTVAWLKISLSLERAWCKIRLSLEGAWYRLMGVHFARDTRRCMASILALVDASVKLFPLQTSEATGVSTQWLCKDGDEMQWFARHKGNGLADHIT